MNKRHIVLADLHGNLKLYENGKSAAGYNPQNDILVVAGDWTDVGNETEELWKRINTEADVILLGNHELAHIAQQEIVPYDSSIDYTDLPIQWAKAIMDGRIKLAYATPEGVLITHAGISETLLNSQLHPYLNNTREPKEIARILNEILKDSIYFNSKGLPELKKSSEWLIHSPVSPLWWRPLYKGRQPAKGITQIAGHTPPSNYTSNKQRKMIQAGLTLIDPYAKKHFHRQDYFRYGVIEEVDGKISVNRRDYNRSGIFRMTEGYKK